MPPRKLVSGRESESPRVRFMEELALLRRESGKSLRQVGEEVHWDHAQLARMESGKAYGGPELVAALDKMYGTTHLMVLWELAKRDPTQFRERYQAYMALEQDALSMQTYSASVVPGLFQTERYARELLRENLPSDELEQQVAARLARQELLTLVDPPHVRSVLSEAVLRTPLKELAAWRGQLARLLAMCELPNIALQVLPMATGPHGLSSIDTVFLALRDGTTVAYTESGYSGELVEDPIAVDRLRMTYDQLRDLALSPGESAEYIKRVMEDSPCDPTPST